MTNFVIIALSDMKELVKTGLLPEWENYDLCGAPRHGNEHPPGVGVAFLRSPEDNERIVWTICRSCIDIMQKDIPDLRVERLEKAWESGILEEVIS